MYSDKKKTIARFHVMLRPEACLLVFSVAVVLLALPAAGDAELGAPAKTFAALGGKACQLDVIKGESLRPIVGAIKWDAWLGDDDSVGVQVDRSLSPNHWHYRVPFYGVVLSENRVTIDAATQAIADQEIIYAKHAGLDYFAFVIYQESHTLSDGLKLYLSSSHKSDVNFCMILESYASVNEIGRYIRYFKDPFYQTVLSGRPLVYTFGWIDRPDAPVLLQAIEDACSAQGIPEPYFVDLHWPDSTPEGFDAISMYAHGGGSPDGAPFAQCMASDQSLWNSRLAQKQVPPVTTGWDGRPRIENPPDWVDPNWYTNWYQLLTPQELATQVQDAIDFVNAHPESCESRAILIYAWNEFDEGGWICPTLPEYGGTERIDALRQVLVGPPPPPSLIASGSWPIAEQYFSLTCPQSGSASYQFNYKANDSDDWTPVGTGQVLEFDPLTPGDAGIYQGVWDDGAGGKGLVESAPYLLVVLPADTYLPVAGLTGLGLLAIASVVGGGSAIRRRLKRA
jgi:hypothetical protein